MKREIIRALAISGILMCLVSLGSSQVTLSKGWGPGKRSTNDDTCKLTTRSMMAVCHTLVSELKRLIACELRGTSAAEQPDEVIPSYRMLVTDER